MRAYSIPKKIWEHIKFLKKKLLGKKIVRTIKKMIEILYTYFRF